MDQIEMRPVREDEFPAVLSVAGAAFGEEYSEDDVNAWRFVFPFERSLAAFEASRMVAISTVFSLELTVPGGVAIPMGGLSWIATLPTHRRRGLLRRLVEAQFADMAARGEIASGLCASEGIIYGRFGYGPATSVKSFTVERAHAACVTPVDAAAMGRFTMLDSGEAAAKLSTIYENLRLRQPGAVSRASGVWQSQLADPPHDRGGATRMFHVMHESSAGNPDGYVSYRVKENCDGAIARNDARVIELLAAGPGVYGALWNYVLGTDLCHTVSCARGRTDEPLRWLLADPRRLRVVDLHDFLWLRLLDVPRALAARRYATAGRLVMEVIDPFPKPNVERLLLSAEPDPTAGSPAAPSPDPAFPARAECAATPSAPDLTLGIDALGAAYLGGVTFSTLATAGRVRESTLGAVARADAMFATATAPYCMTEF